MHEAYLLLFPMEKDKAKLGLFRKKREPKSVSNAASSLQNENLDGTSHSSNETNQQGLT